MSDATQPGAGEKRALLVIVCLMVLAGVLLALPAPAGLPEAGKRVIAVALFAIGLWCTEALPAGVTALVNAPKLDDNLWQLMIGMLGMGALRSFEKVKGVAAK